MISKISQEDVIQKLFDSEMFWLIYLACLEKPRNLWEISECYDFMKEEKRITKLGGVKIKKSVEPKLYKIPDTRIYNQKALIEKMVKNSFLKEIQDKRSVKYLSIIIDEEFANFIENNQWIRKEIFTIENIKLLYKFDELKDKLIRKSGEGFVSLVKTVFYCYKLLYNFKKEINSSLTKLTNEEIQKLGKIEEAKKIMKDKFKIKPILDKEIDRIIKLIEDVMKINFSGFHNKISKIIEKHMNEIILLKF